MFRELESSLGAECCQYLLEQYKNADLIVEYGSGRSTCDAAAAGKTVVAVESSAPWLVNVMAFCAEHALPGRVVPLWADIGPTKDWGYPIDESMWKQWHRYPVLPWEYCHEHRLSPDVVLIDGRFRVACFLATCMAVAKATTVMFDDFVGRPHYHTVLEMFPDVEYVGNRMAVFKVVPGVVDSACLLKNLKFFTDNR